MEILGLRARVGTVLVEPCSLHFILLKSDMPSQVSSMFRKEYPASHISRNFKAHFYLRMRFYGELEW